MGTYLPKPITEKVSEDNQNNFLSYGSSAMQGWRNYQEDAHNTILDYEATKSFFAVYDGHGGHEVAVYTAENFPKALKSSEKFSKADYSTALKETFLNFDETLVKPEIQTLLREIVQMKDETDSEDEREEVNHLCREASMPLAEVMERYSKVECSPNHTNTEAECSSSSFNEAGASGSGLCKKDSNDCLKSSPSSSKSTNGNRNVTLSSKASSSENKDILANGIIEEHIENRNKEFNTNSSPVLNGNTKLTTKDESSISCEDSKSGLKAENNNGIEIKTVSDITSKSDSEAQMGSCLKGNSQYKGKGKCLSKRANLLVNEESLTKKADKRLIQKRKAAEKAELIYKQIQNKDLPDHDEEEEDEEDLDEEIEEVEEEENDGDDAIDSDEDSEEEQEEEEEIDLDSSESELEEEILDDDENTYNEFSMNMREDPGYDSGCTACVVLVHDSILTVANVGDSRCVVCRDGKAIDMSIDHKPEDTEETNRIIKAGGKITRDKRVNGGLNLSRAIGDHSYKQNKSLKPEEQMISPMPDTKSLDITPEDSFMIIACDGIWNSLTSQEACEFVSSRLKPDTKLSSLCEEMFDHCLAPNVFGDGTGCDNMTCIIVRFNHNQKALLKRELNDDPQEVAADAPQEKRLKTE